MSFNRRDKNNTTGRAQTEIKTSEKLNADEFNVTMIIAIYTAGQLRIEQSHDSDQSQQNWTVKR